MVVNAVVVYVCAAVIVNAGGFARHARRDINDQRAQVTEDPSDRQPHTPNVHPTAGKRRQYASRQRGQLVQR